MSRVCNFVEHSVRESATSWALMRTHKAMVLAFAEKCKNILTSNWHGRLHTIKTDAQGSDDVHSSRVKYLFKKGEPYIWVPETDLHAANTIIDERGSFSVTSPFPGPLASILRSIQKTPAQVALTGDVQPLDDNKAEAAEERLRATISSELKAIRRASYAVTGLLSSSVSSTSRSENLQDLLDESQRYIVCKFNVRSCTFVDCDRGLHEVKLEDVGKTTKDLLSPYAARIIDGINENEARRQALTFFCFTYFNTNARDAYMLSVDQQGFDVLAKVVGPVLEDGSRGYQWKEFRFMLSEEAWDIETFCSQLVEMEEEVLKQVKSISGLS